MGVHHHNHHDHHQHADADHRMGWAFFLNLGFTIVEFIGGFLTNSTAIMADAVHDLGDCVAIGLAWWLQRVSRRGSSGQFSYGYRRFSLLGALINGLILTVGSVWVLTATIPRLFDPVMPHAQGMMALAVLGIAVNGIAAFKLRKGRSLNEQALNWHLLEDVLGWLAILIVAVVLQFAEWPILDPLLSIAFTSFILVNVARNLIATGRVFFQGVPDTATQEKISQCIRSLEGVRDLHHMHYWTLDGEHHVLTAHVLLSEDVGVVEMRELKQKIAQSLKQFDITHTTLEFEFPNERCRDERC